MGGWLWDKAKEREMKPVSEQAKPNQDAERISQIAHSFVAMLSLMECVESK